MRLNVECNPNHVICHCGSMTCNYYEHRIDKTKIQIGPTKNDCETFGNVSTRVWIMLSGQLLQQERGILKEVWRTVKKTPLYLLANFLTLKILAKLDTFSKTRLPLQILQNVVVYLGCSLFC